MVDIFPSWFRVPKIKLTIDEIVYKFTDECDKEHHELLLKEQNNMIRELTIVVHQLSKDD